MDAKWARPWFAMTAAIVAVEIVLTTILAAQAKGGLFDTAAGRVFNVFWYFTIQSTVVPVLAVVGWVAFGPRGLTSSRVAKLTVAFPLVYMVATAIRGPLAKHFYPYPFANVTTLGYARVTINGLWISLLFYGVAAGANALDQRWR